MAVPGTALTCYQDEDVVWTFEMDIAGQANVPDISGQVIVLVVKATAAAADPPLIGPVTGSVLNATDVKFETQITLDPGAYVYGIRRTDIGESWQYAQGALTVLDSANID